MLFIARAYSRWEPNHTYTFIPLVAKIPLNLFSTDPKFKRKINFRPSFRLSHFHSFVFFANPIQFEPSPVFRKVNSISATHYRGQRKLFERSKNEETTLWGWFLFKRIFANLMILYFDMRRNGVSNIYFDEICLILRLVSFNILGTIMHFNGFRTFLQLQYWWSSFNSVRSRTRLSSMEVDEW